MARRGTKPFLLLLVLALLLAGVGYLAVGTARQVRADRAFHPVRVPAATAAAPSLAALLANASTAPSASPGGSDAPVPTPAGVAAALAPKLTDAELGPSLAGQVFDAGSGALLFDRRSTAAVAPASTAKLLTAAAVLTVHQATDRFTTTVVAGSTPATVVLVGGGDPTLSAAPVGQASQYAEAARIADLAAQVRAASGGVRIRKVIVDGSAFAGPGAAPGWEPQDTPSAYASEITAAMVDGGRDGPGADIRSAAPDLAAGKALATALGGADVGRGRAPAGAKVLGRVRSAPVSVLVEQMLRASDNVIAEVLGRQVAIAAHEPATFAGAAAAIRTTLAGLGISVGTGMLDGSGLSLRDRIPAAALAKTLLTAVAKQQRLRPLLSGLSIAGWDGTLLAEHRFGGAAAIAAGAVRAKTGSLTSVSSMAGLLTDADGRMLVFSFVVDRAPSEGPSRAAVDNLVAALVRCGCR